MDRRTFLRGAVLGATAGLALPGRVAAAPYRRCDQIHQRLTEDQVDHWAVPLPLPPTLRTEPLGPGGVEPDPPVGAVEQGTAPEFFWGRKCLEEIPENSQWGEWQPPGRPQDIFRKKGVPVHFAHLAATDAVVEAVPGWLTRRIVYRQLPFDGSPIDTTVLQPPWNGPVMEARLGHPMIVRLRNDVDPRLMLDVSMHQHGGHLPAHSDGHPNFMLLPGDPETGQPGQSRDYYYPNTIPLLTEGKIGQWKKKPGEWDWTEVQSTMWYHDHAEDITAHNALMGLASFYFLRDELEDRLRSRGVLPPRDHEIPLVFQDVCLCPVRDPERMQPEVRQIWEHRQATDPQNAFLGEARIHFDPFDHNGTLGDIVLTNGAAYPYHEVRPEAYWLRMLNASLARFYNFEFWVFHPQSRQPRRLKFLRFGRDSWMFAKPMEQNSIFLGMANRADLYLDFGQLNEECWREYWEPLSGAGNGEPQPKVCKVYLVSTLNQKDGRGPGHGDNEQELETLPRGAGDLIHEDRRAPMLIMQFRVVRPPEPKKAKPAVPAVHRAGKEPQEKKGMTPQSRLRPYEPLPLPSPGEIYVREFNFERRRGAWQINHRFYDSCVANAVPELWSTELWILRNRSGGWWHPVHIHLESHQQLFVMARNHRGERIVKRLCGYDPTEYDPFLEITQDELQEAEKKWSEAFPWQKRREDGQEETQPDDPAWWHDATQRSFDDTVWNLDIKHDTTILGPNTEVHVLIRFRTFQGPFVFHCHNLDHEDMRMMFQFDPRADLGFPQEDLKVRKDFFFFHFPNGH